MLASRLHSKKLPGHQHKQTSCQLSMEGHTYRYQTKGDPGLILLECYS